MTKILPSMLKVFSPTRSTKPTCAHRDPAKKSCCADDSKDRTENSAEKRVSFGDINLHEHDFCLGDNPSCSSGPPMTIKWQSHSTMSLSVDEFEMRKEDQALDRHGPGLIMCIPHDTRLSMLLRQGVSALEIDAVTYEISKLQDEQQKSVQRYFQREFFFGKFRRICRRFFKNKN
mmetsp:Transcript_25549/g.38138  ORF Transcript_25549/g.38138 Transcript_25549/m.38138 type:complete len:175 (-) Transcript_25549:452-976(-)